jgi:integrase
MSGWLDKYLEIFQERDVAANTLRSRRSHIKAIRAGLGNKELAALQHNVKMVADFIDEFRNQGKYRMAQAVRSALIDVFDEAKRSGYINENPASITRATRVKVQRTRLKLDDFNSILDKAYSLDPWVANSMLLGITTGQRLDDIANMQFKNIADNWLHVEQAKTGAMLRLSLDLQLGAIGITIGDVVSQCRDRVVSRHLTHHTRSYTKARPGHRP